MPQGVERGKLPPGEWVKQKGYHGALFGGRSEIWYWDVDEWQNRLLFACVSLPRQNVNVRAQIAAGFGSVFSVLVRPLAPAMRTRARDALGNAGEQGTYTTTCLKMNALIIRFFCDVETKNKSVRVWTREMENWKAAAR